MRQEKSTGGERKIVARLQGSPNLFHIFVVSPDVNIFQVENPGYSFMDETRLSLAGLQ